MNGFVELLVKLETSDSEEFGFVGTRRTFQIGPIEDKIAFARSLLAELGVTPESLIVPTRKTWIFKKDGERNVYIGCDGVQTEEQARRQAESLGLMDSTWKVSNENIQINN